MDALAHAGHRVQVASTFRTYDGDVESEAYGVGGAMILPYGQLFRLVKQRVAARTIAERYKVSERFANYRINRAGLRKMYVKSVGA